MEQFIKSNNLDISESNKKSKIKQLFKLSRKNIYFFVISKSNINNSLNTSNKINLNISSDSKIEDTFLGKKNKKRIFKTLNNLNKEDNNILKSQNSNTLESTSSNKINQTSGKENIKTNKVKLFNITRDNYPKQNLNKGRWSYDEHIKFITALVNFGKKYTLIQEYISSRSYIQIKSHAQKYFKKLKRIKNNEYDFSSNKIKDLFDIFDIIENNNKTKMNNKEYIINTLINLNNERSTQNKINENKNKDKLYSNNNLAINNQNKIGLDINNIFKKENIEEQINYLDNSYLDNTSNNKSDEDNISLPGDSDFIFQDENLLKEKDNIFLRDKKSSLLNFISKYFS